MGRPARLSAPRRRSCPRSARRRDGTGCPACAASPAPAPDPAGRGAHYIGRSPDRSDAPARCRIRRGSPPPRRPGCRPPVRAPKSRARERAHHHVERHVMAAHDDDVGRARAPIRSASPATSLPASSEDASASISMKPSACEKLVTEPEPLPVGKATMPCPLVDQRHQQELLAPEFGGDAHRHGGGDGLGRFRRQAGARADHRRDVGVEGEDRRGREAGQHHDRLVPDARRGRAACRA